MVFLKTTIITVRPNALWYDVTIASSKRNKRKLERNWHKTRSDEDKYEYMQAVVSHTKLLNSTKENHYNKKIESCEKDQKKLCKVLNGLLGQETPKLPQYKNEKDLAEKFNNFFVDKIKNIRKKTRSGISKLHASSRAIIAHYPE